MRRSAVAAGLSPRRDEVDGRIGGGAGEPVEGPAFEGGGDQCGGCRPGRPRIPHPAGRGRPGGAVGGPPAARRLPPGPIAPAEGRAPNPPRRRGRILVERGRSRADTTGASPMRARILLPLSLLAFSGLVGLRRQRRRRRSGDPAARPGRPRRSGKGLETAVLAGGCFWGVQGVFEHVKGVTSVVAGYSGGEQGHRALRDGRHRDHRPRRVGGDHLRPAAGSLRPAPAHLLLGRARSDAARPPGPRQRPELPLADLLRIAAQEKVARAYVAQLDKAGVFARRS